MNAPTTTGRPAAGDTTAGVPEAGKPVVEAELRRALRMIRRRKDKHGPAAVTQRVLLLRAAPDWRGPDQITVPGEDPGEEDREERATVRGCGTVLAVLDALSDPPPPGTYLVVLTPCDDGELGKSVLAQAIGNEIRPINHWDLVADVFHARRLDPRLTAPGYRWLAEALLDVGVGTRRLAGPVLQLDAALGRLAAARFGVGETDRLDAAALLEWSLDDTRVARFAMLREAERAGLATWLEGSIGPVAHIVYRLLAQGQVDDAVPFGLAAAELYAPAVSRRRAAIQARGRAEERFLGGHGAPVDDTTLRTFAEAAESVTLRWRDNNRAERARAVCDRAEQILAELRAGDLAGYSRILDAGLDARLALLTDLVGEVLPLPRPGDLAQVEDALNNLRDHRRAADRTEETAAAHAAVRLVRWLVTDHPVVATVADGTLWQARSWGWVDRAVATIWNTDTTRVPGARAAYAALFEAVRERRAHLDQAFAERLAAWSPVAGPTDELLLAENLLDRVARPVAERRAPMIIVLDGMSWVVAGELAQEITADKTWIEIGRRPDGREAALAAIPSTTRYSRTSLLCGALREGGQAEERAGFAAFWRGRRSLLFHKAGLSAGAGAALHEDVETAIEDTGTVVGVVLNTIDDALASGRESLSPSWRLNGIAYLERLLAASAAANRPVILTSDHGHVLDRGGGIGPATSDAARYRTGEPAAGEVALRGPRVLVGGGQVVVPWDEQVRYLSRRAGYHGGAALAEMVIPVLTFVPSATLVPRGWARYDNPSLHEPAWWNPAPVEKAARPPRPEPPAGGERPPGSKSDHTTARTRPRRPDVPQHAALFTPEKLDADTTATRATAGGATAGDGLGGRVVASELYAGQRAFVRKAPEDDVVAALIDGLYAAGGKLPVPAAARFVGQPPFRMSGYLAQVGRLLNIDGYRVIGEADGGRTVELNVALLREQFLGAE